MRVVLDSWALLRYLEGTDPVATMVGDLINAERPLASWINLGEVHDIVRRAHGEHEALEVVRDLQAVLDARLPDEALVLAAARIKADHAMSPPTPSVPHWRSVSTQPCGPTIPSCWLMTSPGPGGIFATSADDSVHPLRV